MPQSLTNEKKHPIIHPLRFIALDSLAAYTLYHLVIICWFCADAGRDGKYHPFKFPQKRKEDISYYLPWLFYMEYAMHLLGI